MAKPRGRRIALLSIVAGLAVAGLCAYEWRDPLLETWYLLRVDSLATDGKRVAIEALGRVGSDRSVDALLRLAGDTGFVDDSVRSLQAIASRVRPKSRIAILRGLLALVEKSSDEVGAVLATAVIETGEGGPDLLPVLFEALDFDRPEARGLAANGILHFWRTRRAAVEEILRECSLKRIFGLVLPCHLPPQGRFPPIARLVPSPSFDAGIEIARWLGEHRSDPEARAVAVSLQVFRDRTGNDFVYDLAPVARAWETDASPVVRTAALRIAGFLGNRPDGLDVTKALLSEDDPVLLTEVVEARTLWATGLQGSRRALELWDGYACAWIPGTSHGKFAKPWEKEELERLARILGTRSEPGLRDACSLALASRYRNLGDRKSAPEPLLIPGFRVHEWGVWVEGAEAILPADRILAELPAFVHRSEVGAEDIHAERFFTPMVITKPVVFFQAPEPLSLLVRVGFHGGRPWTFYPAATDYTEGISSFGWSFPRSTRGAPASGDVSRPAPRASALIAQKPRGSERGATQEPPALADRRAVSPPWLKPGAASAGRKERDDWLPECPDPGAVNPRALRPFYAVVPWLVPNHDQHATAHGGGVVCLSSIGLEWCGLRVGHDPALEGRRPHVDPASWWARLREVPSSPVAVRGETDGVLFYDGAVSVPGPLRVSWSDERKDELLLLPRSFEEYPRRPSGVEVLDRWWLSDEEKARARTTLPIPAVLVVSRKEGEEARGTVLESLAPDGAPTRIPLVDLDLGEAALERRLGDLLTAQGLTPEEARSLVETWKADFFRTPGLRAISILPRWMYDAIVPLEVYPVPEETVRVGLVWKECGELETGTSSWGLLSDEERWRPEPWKMPTEDVDLPRETFAPGPTRPLRIGDGGEILESGEPGGGGFALSADGSELAFQVLEGPTCRVLRANLRERWVQEVWRLEGVKMEHPGGVAISADGGRIAFSAELPGTGWTSFLLDLSANVQVQLPAGGTPRLSADGTKALYTVRGTESGPGRESLVLLDVDADKARTILEDDVQFSGFLSTDDLSGDGTKVAFAYSGANDVNDLEVYLVDVVQETILNVSRSAEDDRNPQLSHDGRRVLFESTRTRDHDIVFVDLVRRSLSNVTRRPGDDRFPEITADGGRMIYLEWDSRKFFVVDLETGAKRPIPGTERVWNVSLSADGSRIAFLRWRDDRTRYLCFEDLEARR